MVILLIVVFCAGLLFGIICGLSHDVSKDTKLPVNRNGNIYPAEAVAVYEAMTEAMLKDSNTVANIPHPTADNG